MFNKYTTTIEIEISVQIELLKTQIIKDSR